MSKQNIKTDSFDVILAHCGNNKVLVIKQLRTSLNCSLVDAKKVAESTPSIIQKKCSAQKAKSIQETFSAIGATVRIVERKS